MKNYISVCMICCCVFLPCSIFSQTISAGINGGVSIPQLKSSGDNEISKDYSSRLAATFGLAYPVGSSGEIILDARGAYGLTSIQKDTKSNGESHTGGLFLTLGYAYTFQRQ